MHTPGPWFYKLHIPDGSADGVYQILDKNDVIAILDPNDTLAYGERNGELEANAQLITAAPELLEALKTAIHYIPQQGDSDLDAYEIALAAIAKAEGR